jgi:hypothetical protein
MTEPVAPGTPIVFRKHQQAKRTTVRGIMRTPGDPNSEITQQSNGATRTIPNTDIIPTQRNLK